MFTVFYYCRPEEPQWWKDTFCKVQVYNALYFYSTTFHYIHLTMVTNPKSIEAWNSPVKHFKSLNMLKNQVRLKQKLKCRLRVNVIM